MAALAGEEAWRCRGCGGYVPLSQRLYRTTSEAWHSSCFRCSECQESLTNWYYEKDGKLYCHKDYWAKFGEFCHGCSLLMTGPAMVSEPLPSPLPVPGGQSSFGLFISKGLSFIIPSTTSAC
ncbi:LIM domain kinase 2 [Cricetulus griseus]|uniref:LIM domain kinase 2 n=1 Tax=Cricetulus griseus TaxID=10029 RepID=G3I204_CRIGR|nr:LIM domain kinase 2 [Cricetulus griseus]